MVNQEILEDFFLQRIKDVKLSCVNDESISLPNRLFNQSGKDFWIEFSLVLVGSKKHTESIRSSIYIAYITCCVPSGQGTRHIDNVSSKIGDLFNPQYPETGEYRLGPVGSVYIRGLDKGTGYSDHFQVSQSYQNSGTNEMSVFKQDIKVTFEFLENL